MKTLISAIIISFCLLTPANAKKFYDQNDRSYKAKYLKDKKGVKLTSGRRIYQLNHNCTASLGRKIGSWRWSGTSWRIKISGHKTLYFLQDRLGIKDNNKCMIKSAP